MAASLSTVRDVSDTALWAAAFRARESDRPDALFHDPLAGRLAGERGFQIADALSTEDQSVAWVTRTFLFDQLIAREIARGIGMVVNLGAGLDTRPYRMDLPSSLRWIEVDSAEILAYKSAALNDEKVRCRLERIGLDLRDASTRRQLLSDLASRNDKILVVTEGVLVYLEPEDVAALSRELAGREEFQTWILEIVSPPVLDNMRRLGEGSLQEAGVSFRFGPAEGPLFFEEQGWKVAEVHAVLKTAVQLGRTPIDPKLLHLVPDSPVYQEKLVPWVGVCRFTS